MQSVVVEKSKQCFFQMNFGGGWAPWHNPPNPESHSWHNPPNFEPHSWRPYANNQGGGPMRQQPPQQIHPQHMHPQHIHPQHMHPQHMHPQHNHNSRNGWLDVLSNPYFSRNIHAQNHMTNYERNRMHLFNQPQPPPVQRPLMKRPPPKNEMSEIVKQTLMNNAHVPGLRTGLQMRNAMQQRAKTRGKNQEKIINAMQLVVNFSVFSERIELRWQQPTARKDIKYVVILEHIKTRGITTIEKSSTSMHCDLQVTAGETYKIDVHCKSNDDKPFLIAVWSKQIRAEFCYSELKQLLQKCYFFVSRGIKADPQMHEFCVVYRCKPKIYWDEIHHYCNDVMQKYIKDDNGQPGNLINGKINGLFFSARLLPDMTLPQCSPFGNVRMIINAFLILNPERHNFYFSDFYCNKNIHYVTIVICVIDSETDRYCREKLVRINPLSNPFVKLIPPTDRFGQWRFYINYTLWVELYYTEDIQLDMGQFSAIMATGAGTSKIGGLPNNKHCNMCNLYPIGKKKLVTVEEANRNVTDLDSTMAAILREDNHVDSEVADTLAFLIDRVEERSLSSEELTEKLDKNLVRAVEVMNKIVSKDKASTLASIAKNLNDFISGFNKRRDALIQEVKKLKSSS
ncbi:hypothetical protein GCK72_001223 [Caenorhabditis remanei]|uniref:Phytanoyl-CoA hydroxylase-interacting protein-like C-terminal domain-containing protein n=1 Tax=Caenorhabditis remanei TaxID=31234 RepID=A0A6A5HRR4_CAERE|nr:hypothetical protein GCK72_001223 [Caenorhabditis remanei]KAF1769406.1 hypothetical protein GCK72_001223 [Caenorhabditis remanei]